MGPFAGAAFATEDMAGKSGVTHTVHKAYPSKSMFDDGGFNAVGLSFLKDCNIGDVVLPFDFHD